MRIFIYLYILKLIAQTESATHPKTVNVQLETILEFNDEDKDADIKFIGNIQKILKKIKIALSPESGRRSLGNNLNNDKHIQFTNFILSAINIIVSYDDQDLENAFMILDDEIRKYHYKGCKFYELVEDRNVREFVAKILNDLKKSKAEALRNKLYKVVNIIGNAKLVSSHRQLLDYINSLYGHESSKTFMNILEKLGNYRYKSKRTNMNLIDITRHGIRSVLFDYFSKLNPNVRKDIKKNIENTWIYSKNSKSKQKNEYKENDFVDTLSEETQAYKNSNEDKHEAQSSEFNYNDIKYKILHAMVSNAVKKKHVIKGIRSFFTQRPINNTIKQIFGENIRNKLKLNPSWKENSVNETFKQKGDFLVPIKSAKRKPHSFERKERKSVKKRNKRNKIKTKIGNTKDTEDIVLVGNKRKTNKHQKLIANVEKTETMEDIPVVKDKTRNSLRSESLMKRPSRASQENIFINFNKLDEKRTSDKDIETKAPPLKRKNPIKRKQFKKPPAKLNLQALSNEGNSLEYGNYRRKIRRDKYSETDKEKDNERHRLSAEILRKSFIKRIYNLEKQMEEIGRKVDVTPTNDDVYKVNKKTTEKKAESSTETSNKDILNITVETITTKGTTLRYNIVIGPEYIPDKDNIDNKIQSTEVTTSFAITDNVKANISYRQNSIDSEEAFHTDFDYSEAGIMKKLNLNITLPEEQTKSNEKEENPKIPDGDTNKGKETGLHRININLPEEKSESNKRVIEEKLKKPDRDQNKSKETGLHRINIVLPEEQPKSHERDEIIIDERPKKPDKDKNNGTKTGIYRINIALPEEKSKSNETVIEEESKNIDIDKTNGNETGLQRIEIPIINDSNIILNNEVDEGDT